MFHKPHLGKCLVSTNQHNEYLARALSARAFGNVWLSARVFMKHDENGLSAFSFYLMAERVN